MFTRLLSLSVQTGHKELMKALVESMKGIGMVPAKIRLYTEETEFNAMTKALKKQYKDQPDIVHSFTVGEYSITATSGYQADRPDLVYTYIFAPGIELPEDEKFTSIFVGIKMTPKSFNMPTLEVKEDFKDVRMYVHKPSPKCIRYGVLGDWDNEDRKYLEKPKTTALF